MLVASVGSALAAELGLTHAFAADGPERLPFGDREPLVALMQDTPADKLLPILVDKLKSGTDTGRPGGGGRPGQRPHLRRPGLRRLPRLHGPGAGLPDGPGTARGPPALPVLKVLYRNTRRMQDVGGRKKRGAASRRSDAELPKDRPGGEVLREATRKARHDGGRAHLCRPRPGAGRRRLQHLQFSVQDEVDVHRVVLAWRAWAMLDLIGKEQAHTLLRQSVRFCVERRSNRRQPRRSAPCCRNCSTNTNCSANRSATRKAEDAWVEQLAMTIYGGSRNQAAEAAAAALAEGMSPEAVGEAISLAANRLVLCDPGRRKSQAQPGKPEGSVHGDSVGVHASDSANAWRNIARVSNARNTFASLIVGAYHTAGQSGGVNTSSRSRCPSTWRRSRRRTPTRCCATPRPPSRRRTRCRAVALVHRYGDMGHAPRPVFDLLLRYARQRGRRLARREVLPHGDRGVRRHAPGVPLAAAGGPGPRHRQRVRLPRPRVRGGVQAVESLNVA